MLGAQAQVLTAAQMSLWARVGGLKIGDLDSAIWKDRALVRAWCMRRTMHLLPSKELSVFVRGTRRRAERETRWVLNRGVSAETLDALLDSVLEGLDRPRTQTELARFLSGSEGYRLKFKRGGGWGSRREVPWVVAKGLDFPVGYLLHLVGARGVICSGPNEGNESTFVRADRWVPGWKDVPADVAERELLVRYIKAFGPVPLSDFALWTGMRFSDAKEIWRSEARDVVDVDVEGWKASILESDLNELERADLDGQSVSLLPFFDSFVLGHDSHRNIVDERNHLKVYRPQGWVSPVLLVNGRAQGVWSYVRSKDRLEVRVKQFSRKMDLASRIRQEASDLCRFLGCDEVKTVIT